MRAVTPYHGLRTSKGIFLCFGKFGHLKYLMNGNLVIFPNSSFDSLNIDKFYRHGYADYDLGVSLSKEGFALYSPKDWLGHCAPNSRKQIWKNRQAPFDERLDDFFAINGLNFRDYCYYQIKNFRLFGILRVIKSLIDLFF